MSRRIGPNEFAQLTRGRASRSADTETTFVPPHAAGAVRMSPAFVPGTPAAGAPVQQSGASSMPPPPAPGASATALPAQSRAASRSPPPRRVTRAPAPAPNGGRVTRGFAATPESDRRYLLVDVGLGDLLRQMSPTQVMNLFINALWRHEHAESGVIGQTELRIDESSTTIYWNLEVMGGRPRGRVADLHVVEWSFETP